MPNGEIEAGNSKYATEPDQFVRPQIPNDVHDEDLLTREGQQKDTSRHIRPASGPDLHFALRSGMCGVAHPLWTLQDISNRLNFGPVRVRCGSFNFPRTNLDGLQSLKEFVDCQMFERPSRQSHTPQRPQCVVFWDRRLLFSNFMKGSDPAQRGEITSPVMSLSTTTKGTALPTPPLMTS